MAAWVISSRLNAGAGCREAGAGRNQTDVTSEPGGLRGTSAGLLRSVSHRWRLTVLRCRTTLHEYLVLQRRTPSIGATRAGFSPEPGRPGPGRTGACPVP